MSTAATSSLFRSSNKVNAVAPLSEALNYFVLPSGGAKQTDQVKAKSAVSLALIKLKNSEDKPDAAANTIAYALTVSNLLYPGIIDFLKRKKSGTYQSHDAGVSLADIAATFNDDNDAATNQSEKSIEIEHLSITVTREDWDAGVELVGGRWGVEMFPIGKNVSPENIPGFRTNRINALKNLYKVGDEGNAALSDDALPSLSNLIAIERMFSTYKAFRRAFAEYWIGVMTAGATTREAEAFLVTFRLTDGYGLGAPQFIMDLLYAHPHLEDFPELKAPIHDFKKAAAEYATTDEDLRGFIKVLFGNNHRLFAPSTRGALLAVAVVFKAQTEPSASRFLDTAPYAALIARANNFLTARGYEPITHTSVAREEAASIEEA